MVDISALMQLLGPGITNWLRWNAIIMERHRDRLEEVLALHRESPLVVQVVTAMGTPLAIYRIGQCVAISGHGLGMLAVIIGFNRYEDHTESGYGYRLDERAVGIACLFEDGQLRMVPHYDVRLPI